MQLVDAYLTEVEQHLPREQRSDIVGELRDDIMEQLHALEEQAGRSANVDDERAVLSRLGHPLKIAGSYKSRRYLIGPALYPAYLKTLQTSLSIVLVTLLLLWVALGSESTGVYILKGFFGQVFSISFWVAVVVTIVFLSLEATGEKLNWYHHWSPDQLKPGASPLDYSDLVINVLTEGFFLLMWNSLIQFSWGDDPQWLAGLQYSSVWDVVFWPLNIIVGGFFALHVFVLLLGSWRRWAACLEMGLCAVLLVTLVGIFLSGTLVSGIDSSVSQQGKWADRTLHIVLIVIAGFTMWDGRLAYRRWHKPA